MNRNSTEYKVSETFHPPAMFHDISEHLSRRCRFEIFDSLYKGINDAIRIEKNYRRRNGGKVDRSFTTNNYLSDALDVAVCTIWRWANSYDDRKKLDSICNNINSKKLVDLALKHIPEELADIIKNDIDRYWIKYYQVLADIDSETLQPHETFHKQKLEAIA